MSIRRKKALKRLLGLTPRIEEHLAKIADNPFHSSLNHYRTEVIGWLSQMEEAVRHVGKKTGLRWRERLEAYWQALESSD